jgi:hypothetical protein
MFHGLWHPAASAANPQQNLFQKLQLSALGSQPSAGNTPYQMGDFEIVELQATTRAPPAAG